MAILKHSTSLQTHYSIFHYNIVLQHCLSKLSAKKTKYVQRAKIGKKRDMVIINNSRLLYALAGLRDGVVWLQGGMVNHLVTTPAG